MKNLNDVSVSRMDATGTHLNKLVTNPASQREWNKNFKSSSEMPVQIADKLKKLESDISAKQEALIKNYKDKQIRTLNLVQTENPNFMCSKDGKYYRLSGCEYIEESSVKNVDEQGSYTIEENLEYSQDILVIVYDINNKPISIKLLNAEREVYKSARYIAKRLNMKKELVNQHKLHGYSENSSGFIAKLLNLISEPVASGCYLYKNYNFFRWSSKNGQFELNQREGMQPGSPLMSDYEIMDDTVIRTDYDGAGIVL